MGVFSFIRTAGEEMCAPVKSAQEAGNVAHVASVDNRLQYAAEQVSQSHDVVRGDTLPAIARAYWGDAGR